MKRGAATWKQVVVGICLVVGLLHFVAGPGYDGPWPGFVRGYLIDILQRGHAMRAPDMRQRTQTGIFIQGGHPENHLCLTWALGH